MTTLNINVVNTISAELMATVTPIADHLAEVYATVTPEQIKMGEEMSMEALKTAFDEAAKMEDVSDTVLYSLANYVACQDITFHTQEGVPYIVMVQRDIKAPYLNFALEQIKSILTEMDELNEPGHCVESSENVWTTLMGVFDLNENMLTTIIPVCDTESLAKVAVELQEAAVARLDSVPQLKALVDSWN